MTHVHHFTPMAAVANIPSTAHAETNATPTRGGTR